MAVDKIRMRLNMFKLKNRNVEIIMKKKNIPVFQAEVMVFLYDEDDTKVILKRLSLEREFPVDEETYTTYVKNISDVQQVRTV
ncbi:MAG: hypothetical protein COA38_02935 [Fluviicola sp.]|nr:MAG: hypothetical protein COA38_02935 [Fluviicola sp.]